LVSFKKIFLVCAVPSSSRQSTCIRPKICE
jgi:hypothetical protein